jgi:hypothetical protein
LSESPCLLLSETVKTKDKEVIVIDKRTATALAGGLVGLFALAPAATVAASEYLMISGSGFGSRGVMLFDPVDGTPVNPGVYFIEDFQTSGVLKHAMQVGNEVWISAQLAGRILRHDFNGNYLGDITAAGPSGEVIGNIRGMALIGNTVYVTNAAGTPGPSLVTYDMNGNWQNTVNIAPTSSSPFAILHYNNELLVSNSSADDIQRYDTNGNHLGPFHVGTIAFTQQLHERSNGNVLAAGFSSPAGIYEYDSAGNQVDYIAASGTRGIWELGNGNLLWTNGSGVHVYDIVTQTHTTVLSGFNAQYIDRLVLPAPGALALLGLAGLVGARRRRG